MFLRSTLVVGAAEFAVLILLRPSLAGLRPGKTMSRAGMLLVVQPDTPMYEGRIAWGLPTILGADRDKDVTRR